MILTTGNKFKNKGFTLLQILVSVTILVIITISFAMVAKVAIMICYRSAVYTEMYDTAFRIKEAVKRDIESVVVGANGTWRLEGVRSGALATINSYRRDPLKRSTNTEIDEFYLVGKIYGRASDTGLAELGWWVYEEFDSSDNLVGTHLMHYVVPDDRVSSTTPNFDYDFKLISNDPNVDDILEGSEEFTSSSYIELTKLRFQFSDDLTNLYDEWSNISMLQGLPKLIKFTVTFQGKKDPPLTKEFSYLFYVPQSKATKTP